MTEGTRKALVQAVIEIEPSITTYPEARQWVAAKHLGGTLRNWPDVIYRALENAHYLTPKAILDAPCIHCRVLASEWGALCRTRVGGGPCRASKD